MPSIESNRKTGQTAVENGALVRATTPVNVAPPAPPLVKTNEVNPILRTPLPPSYTQQPDQQRQWQTWGVAPQNRVAPLPPSANAQIGASAASQSIVVQESSSTGTGGGITSVGLAVPSILTVSGSPLTPPGGTITVGLATEPLGTVFTVLPPGLDSVEALNQDSLSTGAGGSDTFSVTATPSTSTSWGLYAVAGNNNVSPSQAGWTGFTGNSSTGTTCASFYQAFSGTSSITASFAFGANSSETGALILFSGALPTIVQQTSSATFSVNATKSLAFSGANTAGNTLLVIVTAANAGQPAYSLNVSDTLGNTYFILDNQQGSGIHPPSVQILLAPNCIGGANTVKATYSGIAGGGSTTFLQIIELSPLSAGPQIPIFAPLTAPQIPPINLKAGGNGGVFGILTVEKGGTALNASVTGGTSQFVRQNTLGGPFTVIQPDFSDLAGATGQLATKYNGIVLVSNGLPSEIAKVDLTNQSANIGATNLLAAAAQQMYRVSAYVVETTNDGAGSTLPNVQIVYTDFNSNLSVTLDATPILAGAGLGQSAALTADTAGLVASGVVVINPKSATAIQYQTVNYASTTPATMKYALHIKLEAL